MALVLIPLAAIFVLLALVVVFGLGLTAVAFGLVREMPWLLIILGVWILLRGRRGHGGSYHRRARRTTRAPDAQLSAGPSAQAPTEEPPAPAARRELPIDVQVKVEQIRRKADVLLGYADRFPPFSHDLHLVRQTTAEYLPRTVDTYLELPGDDDPVTATGKTAQQELREQLQLLDTKLDEIAQALQQQDLNRLLANRRFLEDRFRSEAPGEAPQI